MFRARKSPCVRELSSSTKILSRKILPVRWPGIGSTKPEELREFRRRQLELERKSVLKQLEAVSAKRLQLEAEIALVETQAYHESAQPKPSSLSGAHSALTNTTRPLLIGLAGGVICGDGRRDLPYKTFQN